MRDRWTLRRRSHPVLQSPPAIRLSRWSLLWILVVYGVVALLWTGGAGVGLWLLDGADDTLYGSWVRALGALWGPDTLFESPDPSPALVALAAANGFVSVLLPLFVLGSFVYKLFNHDPLVWRRRLSVEAAPPESHPDGHYTLVARFYNGLRSDATDVRVRAWIRFSTPGYNPTVLLNKRLQFMVRGELVEEWTFPLLPPDEATSVKIVLCRYAESSHPIGEQDLLVQGERVARATSSVVLLVDGTLSSLTESFRSSRSYELADAIDHDLYQDIPVGADTQSAWDNFEGTQVAYVFVYGPAMAPTALRRAGLEPDVAQRARLRGWRRTWNVRGADSPESGRYVHDDGSPFVGQTVEVGVEQAEDAAVDGVAVRADLRSLATLDDGAAQYVRTDVTADLLWRPDAPPHPFRVFTYAPRRPVSPSRADGAPADGWAISQPYREALRGVAAAIEEDVALDVDRAARSSGLPVVGVTE